MGEPDVPFTLLMSSSSYQMPPRWKSTLSPGLRLEREACTLAIVFQGLLCEVPEFESLPELET